MTSLLIDTATERSVIGLCQNGQLLFQRELPLGLNNAKHLAPAIEEGLQCLNLSIKSLRYIGVGVGPGSYTGIRIGAAMAKALSFASKVPVVPICTLKAFQPTEEGPFVVLLDAKISGVYGIIGRNTGGSITYLTEPQVVALYGLEAFLGEVKYVLTPRMQGLKQKLDPIFPQLNWEELPPNLLRMHKVAEEQFINQAASSDGNFELLYLRKTQAEIDRKVHHDQ